MLPAELVLLQNISFENEFDLLENQLVGVFSYELFRTKTHLDTEAKDNFEMEYWSVMRYRPCDKFLSVRTYISLCT